eukprot:11693859-Alexandrium_andersonii.AAC.1
MPHAMAMSKHAWSSPKPGPTEGAMARAVPPEAPILDAAAPVRADEVAAGAVAGVVAGGASDDADA